MNKDLLNQVKWEHYPKDSFRGGQSVGRMTYGVKLIHEESGFEIVVDSERSQLRNKEIAWEALLKHLHVS